MVRSRQWAKSRIGLAFIEFFDWRGDGYQDYQYIRCRVQQSSEHPKLIGADVLLPVLEVTVNYSGGD